MTIKKFTDKESNNILSTVEKLFALMNDCERKAILFKMGLPKNEIEDMDSIEQNKKVKEFYTLLVNDFDMNNPPDLDVKYKEISRYLSGKNKDTLKTEIENYKKL
tara:strand:- start:4124 stop:4438 length:315 start_codon:yes stop_codon:yes gene_type:complete